MTTETATPNQADASTAFLRAARAGQIDKIISLLGQGVDINVSNANGLNAIHLAAKDGHVDVVRELLARGAAIDAATKKGNTALHIASLAGQEAVVKLLVQNVAQINIQSQNGFTPLYMAAQENHDGVVKFLLANGANQSLATEDGFTPLAVAMQQGHEKVVAVLLEADIRGKVRLPALHIAAKKDDVKAANLLLENEHNPDVTSKSGFTPLHIAAHYGNEGIARLLLAKKADVNYPAKHNICPLHVAAKWGKENMVILLCDNNANVEARTRDGLTPLHCAARSGHERVVEVLLDRGAPITSKSKNGLAPLHMAAQGEHVDAARVLLSRRAPVDDVTVDYLTALHVAAHCGHAKVAKLLLDRNADANARALNGFTPLHIACKKNRIKVVELLLKYGASIQATTESGLTPLHVAAFMGCMNIVIYLLQHEANPDVPTVRGETPLHLAARANQTDIIRILLRNGAAVEAKARERQTPLHIASRLGNVDIAVLLLQHGADVRAVTADHYNPLHIAAKQNNHDVAAALIEHNAPLPATTKKGFTALHLAAKYGNLKVANLLLAHGASSDQAGKNGMTPLHIAAQYDQQAVANTLLEKGADAKAVAKNGHTPLHIAARKNQMETAATLLEYGAYSNAESKAGFTPLHLAAQQGHTEMCSLLLENEAEVDHQAKNGLTSLHLAAQEDRVPVAQLLVKNGAQVDICTKGGYTPLHIASHYGQANMVRFLLENGASVKAQTNHGYTALHHAAQQGHINIVNILLEHKADANAITANGQTPLDIASKLGYVTVMETLKEVSEPSIGTASQEKYKVVAPETMLETFMSDSEEEGGEDTILNEQPYRYLTADDMKSLGDDSLPIDVTRDERTESAMSHKNIMEISQGSMNGPTYPLQDEVVVKNTGFYRTRAPKGYCYNVDLSQPNFLVSFLVDARGGAMRGCRGGGVRIVVPPLSAQQPTRITCRYLKPSRINHMPPLMEGEAMAARVLEIGPTSAKFLGPVVLEVPHYASLRGKEREIVILRSDNGNSWREHNIDSSDDAVHDILHETLEIEDPNEDEKNWEATRVTRILTHDFPQYFAIISRIRQEVHAIGPEGGMVSSSVVPQVQAVFPHGALTKKIKVGLQAQIIDSELTAKLLGRGVAVSPVVTVEPRRRKFHKAITLSMPAPRPHTQGMTNQYSTSSAPTLRLLCSISGGTNRAHWEDVTDSTPLTFVNDCVSFTTTVSARYWLIDCRHVDDATKMATELYREAIHVPFMARFVVYSKRTDECQALLRLFCVTDDKEDKALERMERFIQVAKSRDVEVNEGKPIYLEFGGNLVPIAKSGEQLSIPFRAFRENRATFPVMIKTQDLEPICRCQFMMDPKVPKGEPSPTPIAVLNIMVPDDTLRTSPVATDSLPRRTEEQELIWRQRLRDPRLEDICNLLGKDWVPLAYELGVSVATVNQIQAKRLTAPEQAQLMLKLWRTQSGTKAQDNSLELALCRIGRDDIIAPQSDMTIERRIRRNIYEERQASEEIEAYKAEEDNKFKEKMYDENEIEERIHESELDQDEAKYSPEEKSVVDKSEIERTPSPSEESEEEDVKRSVAERKEQITRKLSSSKIPSSKQKKEIREEIIEIKTQIKPDIKKFHDIEQQVKEKDPSEKKSLKPSPEIVEHSKETEIFNENMIEVKNDDQKTSERSLDQFRKYDPSSPAKPTPKHLQRHARNESMRFPSGDFSNITITPRKSVTIESVQVKQILESKVEMCTRETISQKEIDSSKVQEKLDDGDKSPDLITDEEMFVKDIAEATLKDKIHSFESKISKDPALELSKSTVKLTKEALKRHTQEQGQGIEYTQEFVREQSKQLSPADAIEQANNKILKIENQTETIKSVKETIQQFDSKVKQEEKAKSYRKTVRTDSTLVQVSSEEDSEFLKKSTDSETETESQTTVKVEKNLIGQKHDFIEKQILNHQDTFSTTHKEPDNKKIKDEHVAKLEKQITQELRNKISEEEITETLEEKDVSTIDKLKEKVEPLLSVASTKFSVSQQTKTDAMALELQDMVGQKISQESPIHSMADKTDSLGDLQQSTERDITFVSQTESKVYSKDSKHRSDSLDETSQFSDLEEQIGVSPAHKPNVEKVANTVDVKKEDTEYSIISVTESATRYQTEEFLKYENKYSSQIESPKHTAKEPEKAQAKDSPVISAKARQFIETVPEDDSVQECFFSKRIYSDSLEDSEHTDSRRHSEAESLKSDQSDIKAKVSSADFDERAEYEEAADSGSGFGDEKFEESVGFISAKADPKVFATENVVLNTSDETEVIFKKVTPKAYSVKESVSVSYQDDLEVDDNILKPKQEFQMFVTEAEDVDKSFDKDELSDKISSESSREVEISDRKSSECVSDKISSEDGVTEKKTSSEDELTKEQKTIGDSVKKVELKSVVLREDQICKVDVAKRQSVTSAGSGSAGELRLDEKRLSDAQSLTESRDYTFEESEDDIGTHGAQGTHVDVSKDKIEPKLDESRIKTLTAKIPDQSKIKLIHGDSLDDVEGFPEDHVIDHVHKLPYIAEAGFQSDRELALNFLNKEKDELKREGIKVHHVQQISFATEKQIADEVLVLKQQEDIIHEKIQPIYTELTFEENNTTESLRFQSDRELALNFLNKEKDELKREGIKVHHVQQISFATEKQIADEVLVLKQQENIIHEKIQPIYTELTFEENNTTESLSGIECKEVTGKVIMHETNAQLKRDSVQVSSVCNNIPKENPEQTSKLIDVSPIIYTKQVETSYTVTRKSESFAPEKKVSTIEEISAIQESISKSQISSNKFDVSKIRADTLGKFDIGEIDEIKDSTKISAKEPVLEEIPETITEQDKPVTNDVSQNVSTVLSSKNSIIDRDVKVTTKDIVELDKRSYDTKVPQKDERRHSCISPAISLERIAESETEMEEEISKFVSHIISDDQNKSEIKTELKKSDSAMKQMADNIEIIIKQASEEVDLSSEEPVIEQIITQDIAEQVSVDSIIEEAVNTVEEYFESSREVQNANVIRDESLEKSKKIITERRGLTKSLSRDSGEIVIMPRKKHPRTFSVQSSPEEVEEQIYTDSESVDMDKAKVLEIIEPSSDIDGKIPESSFDARKIRTDSLDDADDFPEKEVEYFDYDASDPSMSHKSDVKSQEKELPKTPSESDKLEDFKNEMIVDKIRKTHFVDSILKNDLVSKSTTESSVTTVISTLTKSSEEDQKSVIEDGTSAELSKISGADLMKDSSKTSADNREECRIDENLEEQGTPEMSKKSMDLTKDYSKSSIDSKDTSRDFATNELSKDSTVDLTKDFSKASVESVKDASKSIDEKTYSEDHSSFDVSKTLASDASEGIVLSKEFLEEERSVSKNFQIIMTSSQEPSLSGENKVISEHDEISLKQTFSKKNDQDQSFILRSEQKLSASYYDEALNLENVQKFESETTSKTQEDDEDISEKGEAENEPDIKELNRRCSNLLEDISQGALIRIDSSHVTHDLSKKFSKTPPPSPVDLILKERSKIEDTAGDRLTGLQLRGSDYSFLDTSHQSPRASSAGDSLISETEAHQSETLCSEAARPKSPSKHLADNLSFVNVDQPTITSGAIELVDRTIEKSIDVIDQIKKEQQAVKMEEIQNSSSSEIFMSESRIETSTSSSSVHKTIGGTELKFQSIDPNAVMSDLVTKIGTTEEYSTILSHKEMESRKISGHEFFSEIKQVSSSDDDSLIIKIEKTHELRGEEHEIKEKSTTRKDGQQIETSQMKLEKAHEAASRRSDKETKTMTKSTDDTEIIKVEREFLEQGLYAGRQTKSEEKMTALNDNSVRKKYEVKISERDLSHEQWGKEYFTEPGELEDIQEDDDKSRTAFIDSTLKIIEKDETLSNIEISEKGKVISSKTEHHKEESVIESKDHDDLSSDASQAPSFHSETVERRDSSEESPKSKSRSFKKENEVYEVDFIKEIKVSTSPVKSAFSRTGSQDTQSESEIAPDLPHDEKIGEVSKIDKMLKSPIKVPQQVFQKQIWEVSVQKADSFEIAEELPKSSNLHSIAASSITKSYDSDNTIELKTVVEIKMDIPIKSSSKSDVSSSIYEISDDINTLSKDLMIKSGESIDTEYMVKSIESHEGEILQKSIESTVSAETLHPSEFSTEADSAYLTGTDHKREELKLVKEKSMEDICSSGYDTDLSSAEFHATKLETERVDFDSLMSAQPLADLSVLEKTIDEVKQSLEAAQVEILSEKSDGSSKYKQSPSEFQFKLLISPDRPEVITEEPHHTDDNSDKSATQTDKYDDIRHNLTSENVLQKLGSQDEITLSDEKDTVYIKDSSPPIEIGDVSLRSDSGPHSILETESEIILTERDNSLKDSPEVKLRVQKHMKSKLGIAERRSTSDIEGWSSSGESHYHSFENSESRPLSSDIEVMMTAQSGTEFETALTSHDVSSQSWRTSKDYYTAASSLASRESMKSLDSEGSSHVASIDISDASETLVPSANELKEELMESSTYVEQFLHEAEKENVSKTKDISDEEISPGDDVKSALEPLGKMKRSHEMRFYPKEIVTDYFPPEVVTESNELEENLCQSQQDTFQTILSSHLNTDNILLQSSDTSSIPKIETPKTDDEVHVIKSVANKDNTLPFLIAKVEKQQREFVDVEDEIISVGSKEYQEIVTTGSISPKSKKYPKEETALLKTIVHSDENTALKDKREVEEQCSKKIVHEVTVVPFPVTEKPYSQREFVDVEDDIIPIGSKKYDEILKSKSDSSVSKSKVDKSEVKTPESQLDSKQSSTSSLKTHDNFSTPQTPLSAPSQSSLSTDNGREYVLDDMYDISETPELQSDRITESSKSELIVTTEERVLDSYEKDKESPTSDEFEIVDKPNEMDDFVVIEEVAKEAQESDPEGKSMQIKSNKYVKRHDTEIEEYLSKTSKKQESTSSTSGSLSDEEMLQYESEQKRLQAQELAEIEAGKRWIQMQFEGDPRYEYERVPLEDIKEEEISDFDASRIGSLSSQKESIGSYGSFKNSYGSLSESEIASRIRFRVRGENDDISISSLQEFENLERALMEQYQQNSSSSQDSLNGSLPRRYILSRSQGDDISVSSLKEFEGLESACLEALKAEILAKQKEALLQADPKDVSCSFLEQEKRSYSYSGSSESSPPQKGGSPSQKSGSPSQKSGSPSQKGGSPSQKIGSYGSPSQKLLIDSTAIRKIIDQQMILEHKLQEQITPKIVTAKKIDDKEAFFVAESESDISQKNCVEITEECHKAKAFVCAATTSDGSAESIPGDCEEMMKIMDQEEKSKDGKSLSLKSFTNSGVVEVIRTTTVIQQKFVDGKKVSETITSTEGDGAVDIPQSSKILDDIAMSFSSDVSSSVTSQQSELDSLMTVVEKHPSDEGNVTIIKKTDDMDSSREGSAVRELSPSSVKSITHSIISFSGKQFTDPASGSWSGQDEELSSSGSFSRGARADLMLGSTDSLEATSSNATRATYNYDVDTPMTGSLTSGGSNTMVSSLDTLDPITTVHMESLEHQSTSEHYSHEYEVQEPDSYTERLELDGRAPRAKERTIMFDSTDTLSAVSGDGSVKEAAVEAPAPTFYIGDSPIVRGERTEEELQQPTLSGSCPASLPPMAQPSAPVPAQRRSLTMIAKSPPKNMEEEMKK